MALITFKETAETRLLKKPDALFQLKPPSGRFVHREKQHNALVIHLSPLLKNQSASNLFVYGLPGTGKTALTLDLIEKLKAAVAKQRVNLKPVFVNCQENRTDVTILWRILSELCEGREIPRMGWQRARLIDEFKKALDDETLNLLVVLDEIDCTLRQQGDQVLYTLSRLGDYVPARVSTITISNDVNVMSYLQPKVASSFGRNKVIFTPYNAKELVSIMRDRVKYAFYQGVVEEGVLEKIAAVETVKRGDAREALKLLHACALVALEKRLRKITVDLVDEASERLENEAYVGVAATLPLHQKLLYLGILEHPGPAMTSDDVYAAYDRNCSRFQYKPLSDRMIRNFLVSFTQMGLIDSDVGWVKDLGKKARRITVPLKSSLRKQCVKRLHEAFL